ncbi:MAG: ATP-binding protein [Jatrophihabitans sp.]
MLLVRHDPSSAAQVRREIAADLTAHAITRDSVDDVVLVASELVGNAVVHAQADAQGNLDVAWQLEDGTVIVRVNDCGAGLPRRKQVGDDATSGRGLAIVAAIAADWGVQRAGCGKQVWARVPVDHTI